LCAEEWQKPGFIGLIGVPIKARPLAPANPQAGERTNFLLLLNFYALHFRAILFGSHDSVQPKSAPKRICNRVFLTACLHMSSILVTLLNLPMEGEGHG